MIWAALALLVSVGWLIYLYLTLVSLSNRVDSAWADIDVQLRRRCDLLPDLIALVKDCAGHERDPFEKLAAARAAALDAFAPAEKNRAEPPLGAALRSVLVLADGYPQLKTDNEFVELRATLTDVEDYLHTAHRDYNTVVHDLNAKLQVFPNNLLAPLLGVSVRDYFELDGDEQSRGVPAKSGAAR